MTTPIRSIARQAKQKDKYNILCCPTHERYETGLALTGHEFYAYRGPMIKDWYEKFAPVPENYHILPKQTIPTHIEFDFILSQNRYGQFETLNTISQLLHLPIVSLEHTLPDPRWNEHQFNNAASQIGDINVFISKFNQDAWLLGDTLDNTYVVHHMVDHEVFHNYTPMEDRQSHLLSIVNQWIDRDYCCNFHGWQRITEYLPVHVRGDTPKLSTATETIEELVSEYNNARIFLNTSTVSPVPTSLLEAMACGCAVVSTATCMIPEIIEHGVNGLISNDETELRQYCVDLLENLDKAEELGKAAQDTILNHFHKDRFISDWNKVFDRAAKTPFIGVK